MTAQSPPYVLQAGSHSAQLFRQAVSTLLNPAGGVVGSGDYAVTQNGTPNMSVNIAGGAPGSGGGIWVPGTTLVGVQGLYFGYNDAVVNLALSASNPTNPRIDTAIAQVQDAAYAGATSSFSLSILAGTPAASPVAPSLPVSSLALANMAVAANATTVVNANITDRRSPMLLGATATAWTPLILGSGVTTQSAGLLGAARAETNGVGRLAGTLVNSGATITTGQVLATIPAAPTGMRPIAFSQNFPVVVTSIGTTSFQINSGGQISINAPFPNGIVNLEGITYRTA